MPSTPLPRCSRSARCGPGTRSPGPCRAVDEVGAIVGEVGATPAQVALAWLLAQGDDIAPIPGTKRVARLEENAAADGIELSPEQIDKLTNLTPAAGDHLDEQKMRLTGR
jgi:aryl-alcohol dehydrogenase-like predicted oxidoreductase